MPKKVAETAHLIERVKQKPWNYPICLHMKCDKRDRCLHALETTKERMEWNIIRCVNPLTYSDNGDCRSFRDKDAKARYAFGMKHIASIMKRHNRYKEFKSECMRHFCRTIYYDMFAAHRIIHPGEQQTILECAAKLGVQLPANSFDQMMEATAW